MDKIFCMVTNLRAMSLAMAAAIPRARRNLIVVHARNGGEETGNLSFHCNLPFFDRTAWSGVSPISQSKDGLGPDS